MKTRNRLLAAILTLVVIISILPISAFAESGFPSPGTNIPIVKTNGSEKDTVRAGTGGNKKRGGGGQSGCVTVEITSDLDGATYARDPKTGEFVKQTYVGFVVTYTITVRLVGTTPATNIKIIFIPSKELKILGDKYETVIASLEPDDDDGSCKITIQCRITKELTAGDIFKVTVTATSDGMQEPVEVTHTMKLKYSVITSAEPAEGGSITAPLLGVEGPQEVTYTANPGYRLKSLTLDGKTLSVSAYSDRYTFSEITKDHFFTAEFAQAYDLTDVSVQQTGTLTYSGKPQTPGVTASATAVNNKTVTFSYSAEQNGTYTAEVPAFTNAGTYTVYYKASAADHNDATGSFTVTVKPKTITEADFTALPTEAKVYNFKAQTQEIASSTLTEGTDYEVVYTENINIGTAGYTITGKGNYIGTINRSFTINKAPAPSAIAFPTASDITYGQTLADSVLTGGSVEYGTFAWENPSIVPDTGTASYSVVFTPSAEAEQNCEPIPDAIKKQNVGVTVAKATLTFTAENKAVNQGEAMPALTYTITGLVNGDAVSAEPILTTSAANTDNAGDFAITISGGTVDTKSGAVWTDCYEVVHVNGKLTVKPPVTHTVTSGGGSTWTKGSAAALDFTVTGIPDDSKTFADFTGIDVDGAPVADGNYTATPGSVNISLKSAYLEGLAAGGHTITARFVNGSAQAKFFIRDRETPRPVHDFKFTFTKIWQGGPEDSIDWVLYYPDGTVARKKFNKKIVSEREWRYEAWFASGADYYIIENPVTGYAVRYENVGAYADVTDRCYNGGTIINYKVPQTGDDADLALWFGGAMAGLVLLSLSIHAGKRKKAHGK